MNTQNWLATGLFVLTYPGFFIYHYAAGMHLIPMFAGGLASWVNILGTLVLLPFFLVDVVNKRQWNVHFPAFALLVIFSIYCVYYKFEGIEYQSSSDAFVYNVKMIIGISNLYLIGYYFRPSQQNFSILLFCSIALSILTLNGTYWSTVSFIMGEVRLESGELTSSYQGFSTAYTVTIVTLLAMIVNLRLTVLVVYVGTICIFLLVSRSELLGYFAVVSMLALILALQRRLTSAVLAESGMILLVLAMLHAPKIYEVGLAAGQSAVNGIQFFIYKVQLTYDYTLHLTGLDGGNKAPRRAPPSQIDLKLLVSISSLEGNFRQLEMLELTKSQSLRERLLTFTYGWAGILKSPFWGDYAGHIRDFNNPGMYMHNALSVWQQFGVVSFLIYALLCVRAFVVSGVKVVLQSAIADQGWRLVLFVSVYALSLALVSKSVYWPVPAFAWGLYAARLTAQPLEGAAAGAELQTGRLP